MSKTAPRPERARKRRREGRVAIAAGEDPFALLARTLDEGGLWTLAGRRARSKLRVVIKVDLTLFHRPSTTAVDPQLVEALLDAFHDRGFTNVVVAGGMDSFSFWLENRSVLALADLAGYRFVTPEGRPYDVIDLADDLVDGGFRDDGVLAGSPIARAWRDAGLRVAFCKNKTDSAQLFALNVRNVAGVLPLRDKTYHYEQRLDAADVMVELLSAYPVHFAIVDAFESNHGSAGMSQRDPIHTGTIIAGDDLLLTESVAAAKMGLRATDSPVVAALVRAFPLPERRRVTGDPAPYEGWRNVHPLVHDAARRRDACGDAAWILQPLLRSVDRELFPFKDVLADQINQFATRFAGCPDADPLSFWSALLIGYATAAAYSLAGTYRVMAAKDEMTWRDVPLGIDPAGYDAAEYRGVRDYIASLQPLLDGVERDQHGLRWRYLERSVLFDFARVIPAPFDPFVARVDVAKGIQYMNDYLGGRAVPVARDDDGRVVLQAERNIYLPQPNYVAAYQGKYIDVTKLECAEYARDRHALYWKTIRSENASAHFDDGSVSFERTDDGETRVVVFGRQEFAVPPLWEFIHQDAFAPLKASLVTHAYRTFFTRTLANFEAVAEGREVRIGKAADLTRGEPGGTEPPSLAFANELLVSALAFVPKARSFGKDLLLGDQSGNRSDGEVDANGFVHFAAPAARVADHSNGGPAFARELVEMLRKDLAARTA